MEFTGTLTVKWNLNVYLSLNIYLSWNLHSTESQQK